MTGTEFAAKILSLKGAEREQAILDAVIAGQVPAFIRDTEWSRVKIGPITLYVAPDYFSIGTNDDFLRMPMTPMTAQKIADLYKSILPSRTIVNEIWATANVKLAPSPYPPDAQMETSKRFVEHNAKIGSQSPGTFRLVAGHKKDIVVGPALDGSRVAIYGWHQPSGQPIQGYSTIHGGYYADYSHGVRLVHRNAVVDGKIVDVYDLFKDPLYAKYLTNQGSFVPTFPSPNSPYVKASDKTSLPVKAEPGQPTPPLVGPQASRSSDLSQAGIFGVVAFAALAGGLLIGGK